MNRSGDPALGTGNAAGSEKTLGPREWYQHQATQSGFICDAGQEKAVSHLQRLWDELLEFKAYRQRPLMKALGRRPPPRGLYLYGGVGRGKSMLVDAFYRNIALRRKRRVHFHEFMQEVHQALAKLKSETDPLVLVAQRLCRDTRLLCFDEFHVSDIGDAMILRRLLENLIEGGIVCVITTNYAPDALYPHGLQRARFLPAIDLIKTKMDVVELVAGPDYRLRALEKLDLYHSPLSAAAEQNMGTAFASMAGMPGQRRTLNISGRPIHTKRQAQGIVWFEFAELCGTARSHADYLEIAREFHTVFVSGVPKMTTEQASEARRFTWLVDVFYDQRVKLVISAEVPGHELYTSGRHSGEFSRTVSRLQEMQSREYLSAQHLG